MHGSWKFVEILWIESWKAWQKMSNDSFHDRQSIDFNLIPASITSPAGLGWELTWSVTSSTCWPPCEHQRTVRQPTPPARVVIGEQRYTSKKKHENSIEMQDFGHIRPLTFDKQHASWQQRNAVQTWCQSRIIRGWPRSNLSETLRHALRDLSSGMLEQSWPGIFGWAVQRSESCSS